MKTTLDLILDRVNETNEVSLHIEGTITREQVQRVGEVAKERGMTASFDGHGFLIRKIISES